MLGIGEQSVCDCMRAIKANLHIEMGLPIALRILDALSDNFLGFLDKLAVEVDGVRVDPADGVVLTEDVVRGLVVVIVGFLSMLPAFVRELLRAGAVTALVGLTRFGGAVLVFTTFLTGEVSKSFVFGLGVGRLLVVEGCREFQYQSCVYARPLREHCTYHCRPCANWLFGRTSWLQ